MLYVFSSSQQAHELGTIVIFILQRKREREKGEGQEWGRRLLYHYVNKLTGMYLNY